MWDSEKDAPVFEFLGWTFLINSLSYAMSIAGERTGLFTGYWGAQANSVLSTLIGGFSPLYGTYIVLGRHRQIDGVRGFIRRILHISNGRETAVLTASFCFAMLLAAILAGERTGSSWLLFIPAVALMVLGGGVEEVGWRGLFSPP